MQAIIVDSSSREWEGKGGCLEINEQIAQTRFKANTWSAWSHTTPRHQKFIEKLLTSPAHIITTARSKQDTVQVDGKVKKVGTKEIQRERFEYELTVNFNIDRNCGRGDNRAALGCFPYAPNGPDATTLATGASGGRTACGMIERVN